MIRIIALLLMLPAYLGAAETDAQIPDFTVYNYGLHKCKTFIETIDSKNTERINGYKLWLGGYLSNYSLVLAYNGLLLKKVTLTTVINDLYKICESDKNQYLGAVSSELLVKYVGDKTKVKKYKPSFIDEFCNCKSNQH